MRKCDLSLVLACYNEGETLTQSLNKIKEVLNDTPYKWEMICIDDKSEDQTPQLLRLFSENEKNVSVYFHTKNVGRGGTVAEGIKKSGGKMVGFIDADLEVSPVYISEFIRTINSGFDLAIGKRVYKESLLSVPRYVASRVYVFLVNKLLKLNFKDTEAGYKFFNRKNILPVLFKVKDKRWFFDTEIVARSYWKGLKIASIPVLFLRRNDKKSTVKLIRDAIEYTKCLWDFRIKTRNLNKRVEKDKKSFWESYPFLYNAIQFLIDGNLYKKVSANIPDRYQEGSVLDLGCGTALIFPFLKTSEYLGIDVNPFYLDYARTKFGDKNCFFKAGDLKDYTFPDRRFDLVFSMNVFHHLSNKVIDLILSRMRKWNKFKYLVIVDCQPIGIMGNLIEKLDAGSHSRKLSVLSVVIGKYFKVFKETDIINLTHTYKYRIYQLKSLR